MLSHEEKLERIELIDAVCDAGRLARGLDQFHSCYGQDELLCEIYKCQWH